MRRAAASLSRLNVLALLSDQFRFLTTATNRPAWVVRAVVALIAPAMFGLSLLFGWTMTSAGNLVEALGLLAGVFISAFAIVFGVRATMTARPTRMVERKTARLIDESALTLLAAGLLSGIDAIWLAIVSVSVTAPDPVPIIPTAVTVGISSLVLVYFLLSIRRLHKLYTDTFVPFWRVQQVVDGGSKAPQESETQAAADIDARRNS